MDRNVYNRPLVTILGGQEPRIRSPRHYPAAVWLPRALAIAGGGAILAGGVGVIYGLVELAKVTLVPALATAGALAAASVGVVWWAVRK